MKTEKKKTSAHGGLVKKTTAIIPIELWRNVKILCVAQEPPMDLADAINAGLALWIAQRQRQSQQPKSKPA